jgi:hypothetical protein
VDRVALESGTNGSLFQTPVSSIRFPVVRPDRLGVVRLRALKWGLGHGFGSVLPAAVRKG